jgi:hypothetical protein
MSCNLLFFAINFADRESQFQMYSLQNFGFPYDKGSLMHYKKHDFSTNGQATIESKADPNEQLGNDYFFTKSDVKQINTLYNCPARFLKCKFHVTSF